MFGLPVCGTCGATGLVCPRHGAGIADDPDGGQERHGRLSALGP